MRAHEALETGVLPETIRKSRGTHFRYAQTTKIAFERERHCELAAGAPGYVRDDAYDRLIGNIRMRDQLCDNRNERHRIDVCLG